MTHTYVISYDAYDTNGKFIRNGKIKAHNKHTELQAKIFAEDNLKRKYPNIKTITISSCVSDNPFADLFGDIFK